jgi:hypothetical protein
MSFSLRFALQKKMGDEAAAICSLSRLAPRHADLLEYRLITWSFCSSAGPMLIQTVDK